MNTDHLSNNTVLGSFGSLNIARIDWQEFLSLFKLSAVLK